MPETKTCETCKKDKHCGCYTAEDCGPEMRLWEPIESVPNPKPDDPKALIETVREALGIGLAKTYPTYRGAIAALSRLESALTTAQSQDAQGDERIHGKTCRKVVHGSTGYPVGGYLHGDYDDSPYDVDGLKYCGRCHQCIGSEPAPSAPLNRDKI